MKTKKIRLDLPRDKFAYGKVILINATGHWQNSFIPYKTYQAVNCVVKDEHGLNHHIRHLSRFLFLMLVDL